MREMKDETCSSSGRIETKLDPINFGMMDNAALLVPRAGFENYFKILNLTAVYQQSTIIYQLIINNIGY